MEIAFIALLGLDIEDRKTFYEIFLMRTNSTIIHPMNYAKNISLDFSFQR